MRETELKRLIADEFLSVIQDRVSTAPVNTRWKRFW